MKLSGIRRACSDKLAKPKEALYLADVKKSPWVKIKNPVYSQKEGRVELFEQ